MHCMQSASHARSIRSSTSHAGRVVFRHASRVKAATATGGQCGVVGCVGEGLREGERHSDAVPPSPLPPRAPIERARVPFAFASFASLGCMRADGCMWRRVWVRKECPRGALVRQTILVWRGPHPAPMAMMLLMLMPMLIAAGSRHVVGQGTSTSWCETSEENVQWWWQRHCSAQTRDGGRERERER